MGIEIEKVGTKRLRGGKKMRNEKTKGTDSRKQKNCTGIFEIRKKTKRADEGVEEGNA